jgi:hypothetical protein
MIILDIVTDFICSHNDLVRIIVQVCGPPTESAPSGSDVVLAFAHDPQVFETPLQRVNVNIGNPGRNPEIVHDPTHVI